MIKAFESTAAVIVNGRAFKSNRAAAYAIKITERCFYGR